MADYPFSEYFEYHSGGFLTWKKTTSNGVKVGDFVGEVHSKGYLRTSLKNKRHYVHRIVWEMHNGPIPEVMQVDHINHIKTDNRIENLRLVSNSENHRNMPMQKTNTSGVPGVYWMEHLNKWYVSIGLNGKNIYLGLFRDKDDAIAARKEAEIKYGFHPNHGKDLNHENKVL